jgi:hypothetical protein
VIAPQATHPPTRPRPIRVGRSRRQCKPAAEHARPATVDKPSARAAMIKSEDSTGRGEAVARAGSQALRLVPDGTFDCGSLGPTAES